LRSKDFPSVRETLQNLPDGTGSAVLNP
jgi:hypothetical protein